MNIMAIDIGLNNFICATNNVGRSPFIIKGHRLKNINALYNIKKSSCEYQERMKLFKNRNRELKQFFRKCVKYVIAFASDNAIAVIVVGRVDNWQHRFSKYVYDFEFVPIKWFVDMLRSQCKKYSIELRFVDERFTSGTSFVDNEKVSGAYYNKSRRHDGVFETASGVINGDVNDSYQIMRKAYPNIRYNRTFLTEPIIIEM